MLFLSEALSIANKMEELCYMLGFDSCFSVNREGRGCISTLRSSFHRFVINFSSNHANVEVDDNMSCNWRLIYFYDFIGSGRRRDS
jgi:hypothetical protein